MNETVFVPILVDENMILTLALGTAFNNVLETKFTAYIRNIQMCEYVNMGYTFFGRKGKISKSPSSKLKLKMKM